MADIDIPSRFDELPAASGFQVLSEWSPCDISDEEIKNHFDDFAGISTSEMGLDDLSQETIDTLYNLIVNFSFLTNENKDLLAQSLTEMAAQAIESIAEQLTVKAKNARKMITYFLIEFVKVNEQLAREEHAEEEKLASQKGTKVATKGKAKKGDTTYNWPDWRHCCLKLVYQAICSEPSHLWSMGVVQENFLRPMWQCSLTMLEDRLTGVCGAGTMESSVRGLCIAIISRSAFLFGTSSSGTLSSLSSALLDVIIKADHMGNFIAEICNKSRLTPLCGELLRDISHMRLKSTSTGVKNIGSFIEALAEVNPDLMSQHLATLKVQIDSPAYQIRSSLLHAMGHVITYIHHASEDLKVGGGKDETDKGEGEDDEGDDEEKDEEEKEEGDDEEKEEGEGEEEKDEGQDKNISQLCRVRDALLDILTERTHDISAFTRGAVLRVWVSLLEAKAVPVRRINGVAELAVDRLKDKVANVRKQALSVLTSALDNNPFSGNLDEEPFISKKKEVEAAILERVEVLRETAAPAIELDLISGKNIPKEKNIPEGNEGEEGGDDGEGEGMEEGEEGVDEDDDDDFITTDDVRLDAEIIALRDQLTFVTSVIEFLHTISLALGTIQEMSRSKSTLEIVEAVGFFSRAVNFNVRGTKKSLQSTFSLIWHTEKAVKDAYLIAFKSAYLTDGAAMSAESLAPEEIAGNLIHVCEMCGSSELASLEQIIGELFSRDDLDSSVITALWSMALCPSPSSSLSTSEGDMKSMAGAINILAMIAKFQPQIITASRVYQISQISLHASIVGLVTIQKNGTYMEGEKKWEGHLDVLKAAARCLQMSKGGGLTCIKLGGGQNGGDDELTVALATCAIPLRDLILGSFCGEEEAVSKKWFSACEEAMVSLFHVHPSPDKVLATILAPLFGSLSGSLSPDTVGGSVSGVSGGGVSGGEKVFCSAARLSRLLFVLGQGALCTLVYTEKLADLAKKTSDKKSVNKDKGGDDGEGGDGGGKEGGKGGEGEKEAADAMEDEMGMAAEADADHERIFNHIVERQLVFENILGKFHPLIAFIVANESGGKQGGSGPFSSPIVRETALLALCRYMCVSNGLCEMYLPLLFTALEREDIDMNRTTVMIALADLAFRFPNALEPWTARMYARLSDESVSVRYNTLMVLTHLILNDMIKVKGQVSHVVMCLNDKCEQVRDLANLFFNKLAERTNNPVYNLLGDIIATLSRDKTPATSSTGAHPTTSSTSHTTTDKEGGIAMGGDNKENEDGNGGEKVGGKEGDNGGKGGEKEGKEGGITDKGGEMDDVIVSEVIAVASLTEDTLPLRVLSTTEFQSTLKFLLSFVKKDKQADGLFERLLLRLGLAQTTTQRRNLAYCISELKVSVKGMKKLVELFKNIKDSLHDTQVFDFIKDTITKANKSLHAKPTAEDGEKVEEVAVAVVSSVESQSMFQELDALMSELGTVKERGERVTVGGGEEGEDEEEEEGQERSVPVTASKGKKVAAKKAAPKRKSSRKKKEESSDEEESEEEEEEEAPKPKGKGRESKRAPEKRKVSKKKEEDSDDDEDEMDFE